MPDIVKNIIPINLGSELSRSSEQEQFLKTLEPRWDQKILLKASEIYDRSPETLKFIAEKVIAPTAELPMSLASGMLLWPASKIYGLMALPFGREVADMAEQEIASLGYQPNSEGAKQASELISKGMDLYLTPSKMAGKETEKLSPRAAYLVNLGGELMQFAFLGAGVKGAKGKIQQRGLPPKPKVAEPLETTPGQPQLSKSAAESAQVFIDEFARSQKPSGKQALLDDLVNKGTREAPPPSPGMKEPYRGAPIEIKGQENLPYEPLLDTEAALKKATKTVRSDIEPKVKAEFGVREDLRGRGLPEDIAPREYGLKVLDRTIPESKKVIAEEVVNNLTKEGKSAQEAAVLFDEFLRDNQSLKGKIGLESKLKTEQLSSNVKDAFVHPEDIGTIRSLPITESRTIDSILKDINDLIGEKGQATPSGTKFTQKQLAAANRLKKDLSVIKRNAERTGKNVEKYLSDLGYPKEIAAIMQAESNNPIKFAEEVSDKIIGSGIKQTVEKVESVAKERSKIRQAATRWKNELRDFFDVEQQFKESDSPETGFHVKNYFTKWDGEMDKGVKLIEKVSKIAGYDKRVMNEAPLVAESISRFSKADPMMKTIAKEYYKFRDDLKAKYKSYGVEFDFKKRIIQQISDLLKNADPKDKPQLEKALAAARDLDFVHIPVSAGWFENKLASAEGSKKVLKLLATQKRKSLSIQSLIDRGLINSNDVNIADIIASQARRAGRDFALLEIKNAAIKEGMASIKPVPGWHKPAAYEVPILSKFYLHPKLHEYIRTELVGKGLNLGKVGKIMSLSKMASFINPGILPMYDTIQQLQVAALDKGFIKIPKYWAKAIRHKQKGTPEYYEIFDHGVPSKPHENPWGDYQSIVRWAQKNKREKVLQALKTVYPQNTIKNLYNASWHLAWEMDQTIRTATYFYLKDHGYSPREAGQIAAKAHSDYASVPPKARRLLNIPFFTPTFKVTMGKFHYQMVKDAAKFVKAFGKVDPKIKRFGKAAISTLMISEAFHLFMKMQGFEMDEWGRRYVKRDVETKEGEKDLVVTWSVPSNLINKYIYRFIDSTKPEVDNGLLEFFSRNRWEFHPIWRTGYEVVRGKDNMGNMIFSPFDEWPTRTYKRLKYFTQNIVRITSLVGEDRHDKEARVLFAKETNLFLSGLSRLFGFTYLRSPEALKIHAQMNHLISEFERLQRLELRNMDDPKYKVTKDHYKNFWKKMDDLEERIKNLPEKKLKLESKEKTIMDLGNIPGPNEREIIKNIIPIELNNGAATMMNPDKAIKEPDANKPFILQENQKPIDNKLGISRIEPENKVEPPVKLANNGRKSFRRL